MICICCPLWNEQLFSFWEDTSLVWRRGMRYTWLIDFHLHNTKKNHINGIYYVIYHPLFGVFQSKPQKPPQTPSFPLVTNPPPSGVGSTRRGISPSHRGSPTHPRWSWWIHPSAPRYIPLASYHLAPAALSLAVKDIREQYRNLRDYVYCIYVLIPAVSVKTYTMYTYSK